MVNNKADWNTERHECGETHSERTIKVAMPLNLENGSSVNSDNFDATDVKF